MSEWKDISSAPMDGSRILIAPHMMTAWWEFGDETWMILTVPLNADRTVAYDWSERPVAGYCVYADAWGFDPTHWQPLPTPPEAS